MFSLSFDISFGEHIFAACESFTFVSVFPYSYLLSHSHSHRSSVRRSSFIVCRSFESGLFSFGSTTVLLSLYQAGARDITTLNDVIGMGLFCSGLAQLLAWMWEFRRGNTFNASGA